MLGYDPTAKAKPQEYEDKWINWNADFPNIGESIGDGWYCLQTHRDYSTLRSQIKIRKYPLVTAAETA